MLSFILLIVCIIATVVMDALGDPPNYLVGLLGTAAGAFFAAIGSDKQKKDADVAQTAQRAEAKADAVVEVARQEHPEAVEAELARVKAELERVNAEKGRVEAETERKAGEGHAE
jgi:hypothetical protein